MFSYSNLIQGFFKTFVVVVIVFKVILNCHCLLVILAWESLWLAVNLLQLGIRTHNTLTITAWYCTALIAACYVLSPQSS